jgi:hypothetical protein
MGLHNIERLATPEEIQRYNDIVKLNTDQNKFNL